MNEAIQLSLVNAVTPPRLSKAFQLENDQLVKLPGGQLVEGEVQKIEAMALR